MEEHPCYRIRSLLISIALIALLSSLSLAASQTEMNFNRALQAYEEARFTDAASIFRELAFPDRPHPKVTASHLMWARSLLKQHSFDQALDAAASLSEKYPASSYNDDAHYIRAEAFFGLMEYINCAAELITVIEEGTDNRLQDKARDHLQSLSKSLLTERQRRSLSERAALSSTRRIVLGLEETILADQGLVIGVVLPLTGPDAAVGLGLKQGIEFALNQWKNTSKLPVFLSIHDSKSSAYATAQIARDLLELEKVSMILCAGNEGIVTACASQSDAKHIPCLILNPQTYSLTTLGESVFQLYPDRRTEGEALARYAVETLGLRTYAVLASATDQGKEMANGFAETVEKHGGEILIQEWFYPGSLDFDVQFTRIRERGWGIFEAAQPDTEEVPEEEQAPEDSIWAYLVNGEILDMEEMDAEDSLEIPIDVYDGFLIVPDPDDVDVLAPQFVYYNFNSQLIGSRDWDYEDAFETNRNYLSGIVYSSDVFWDPDYSFDVEWISDFRIATGATPEQPQIMGFDGTMWLLNAIRNDDDSPEELRQRLFDQPQFRGKGGAYNFNERMNISVPIAKYTRGRRHLLYP